MRLHQMVMVLMILWLCLVSTKPWDGTYRGEMVQSGTYVYEVQYVSVLDGSITRKRGNLSVLK